jgi:hypothetical protein
MKDWLMGCYFKDVVEVQVTLKTVTQEVAYGGFLK